MSSTTDLAVTKEVDEIDEQLTADGAHETGRVPADASARPRRKHSHLTPMDGLTTLLTDDALESERERSDTAATETLPLPASTEQPQLLLLLITEAIAVAHLIVVGWQLLQELFDAVLLPHTVHIRHLVLRQATHVLVHLRCIEAMGHPRVLLKSTAAVII
jgi:hypothetical protein